MQLQIRTIGDGQHPSEAVVKLEIADGSSEEIIVDKRSIDNEKLQIGYPISKDGDLLLVELPRETLRGLWRVWVNKDLVEGTS